MGVVFVYKCMKRIKFILLLLCFCLVPLISFEQTPTSVPVGQWRDHLSSYFTHAVFKVDNRILVAGMSSLFYFDPKTEQMEKLNKVNGLSDVGVEVVSYDNKTNSVVITYDNSNIDILQNGDVYNISDIKDRIIEGSKDINDIFFADNKAYLACGFGIVVLDLQRHEIYDTWYLGENSTAINITCVYIDDTCIYAGTEDGILYADKNSKTLATAQSWKTKYMGQATDKEITDIIAYTDNSILIQVKVNNSTNSHLLKYNGVKIDTLKSNEYIVKVKKYGDLVGIINYQAFTVCDTNLNQLYYYDDVWNPLPTVKADFMDFYIDTDTIWLAHHNEGLVVIPNFKSGGTGDSKNYYPTGPLTNDVFSFTFDDDGMLYVARGGIDQMHANKYRTADVYTYNGYYWTFLDYGSYNNYPNQILDALQIAIDPKDKTHLVAASWWNGLLDIKNNTLTNIFDSTNTNNLLQSQGYSYRIAGVGFDRSGNLFAAASLVPYGLVYRTFNNEWGNFYTYPYIGGQEINGLTLDYFNSYKLIYTASNSILLINNQGEMKLIDPNNGSLLQTSSVNCLTQDKEGEIWIGTEKGIKVIYSLTGAFDMNSSAYDVQCNNIVYSEKGIAQYLLSFENVKCIMVDGANRKWVGTDRSGIYVLSANGDKEIAHFTAENSPLFSNKVICMAQSPTTGEVFIGTDRGIISYRAESLEPKTEDVTLQVFPNPVRPDYTGYITIKGFVEDSDVKITDANGRLVAHLQSLGGQVVWDGLNFEGQRVGSGVYFVFASANEGENTTKGKFLIVR